MTIFTTQKIIGEFHTIIIKNSGIKGSDILWSVLECKKLLEKVVKVTIKKTNKKLKVTIKFTQNVDCKYLDAKIYIAENVKEKT